MTDNKPTLLAVQNLKKYFPVKGGFLKRTVGYCRAVDDVSFTIERGKTMGLVGESGCGKSTLGRTILNLQRLTEGNVIFEGKDISCLKGKDLKALRRQMQIIFQDPFASLNPRMTVREIISEPLKVHKIGSKQDQQAKLYELLSVVGMRKAALNRYPHEFSGGQRQRIGIARALALNPKFIVADEPVSALDVSVQSQVLNLISDLQHDFGISFLFISHDLSVVQHISHDVGVMYLGKLVEKASAEDLYDNPQHPYTKSLLSAIPSPDPAIVRERIALSGDVPSPIHPPSGCPFHPRCPEAIDICRSKMPKEINVGQEGREHLVSCHVVEAAFDQKPPMVSKIDPVSSNIQALQGSLEY
jgi:peptide/nickel transport system ATP-binding protein/oligopeptide transport system ATP-binding protein